MRAVQNFDATKGCSPMIIDGIDYGDGYTKATEPGPEVEIFDNEGWTNNSSFNTSEFPKTGVNLFRKYSDIKGYKYRRPMTQAEKDAEAGKPKADEFDLVGSIGRECLGMADRCVLGLPYEPTVTAARIVAMVREHDAGVKQK
jgi:hypothetical protein